jgi:hypothetical protein
MAAQTELAEPPKNILVNPSGQAPVWLAGTRFYSELVMATLSQRKKQPERGAGCGVRAMSPSTTPKKMASAFDIAGSGKVPVRSCSTRSTRSTLRQFTSLSKIINGSPANPSAPCRLFHGDRNDR